MMSTHLPDTLRRQPQLKGVAGEALHECQNPQHTVIEDRLYGAVTGNEG